MTLEAQNGTADQGPERKKPEPNDIETKEDAMLDKEEEQEALLTTNIRHLISKYDKEKMANPLRVSFSACNVCDQWIEDDDYYDKHTGAKAHVKRIRALNLPNNGEGFVIRNHVCVLEQAHRESILQPKLDEIEFNNSDKNTALIGAQHMQEIFVRFHVPLIACHACSMQFSSRQMYKHMRSTVHHFNVLSIDQPEEIKKLDDLEPDEGKSKTKAQIKALRAIARIWRNENGIGRLKEPMIAIPPTPPPIDYSKSVVGTQQASIYVCIPCKTVMAKEEIYVTHIIGKAHKDQINQMKEWGDDVEKFEAEIRSHTKGVPIEDITLKQAQLTGMPAAIQVEIDAITNHPMIGLDKMNEVVFPSDNYAYECTWCNKAIPHCSIVQHITGHKHMYNVLKNQSADIQKAIDFVSWKHERDYESKGVKKAEVTGERQTNNLAEMQECATKFEAIIGRPPMIQKRSNMQQHPLLNQKHGGSKPGIQNIARNKEMLETSQSIKQVTNTKDSKGLTPEFTCTMCNVTVQGEVPYAAHMAGQKHKARALGMPTDFKGRPFGGRGRGRGRGRGIPSDPTGTGMLYPGVAYTGPNVPGVMRGGRLGIPGRSGFSDANTSFLGKRGYGATTGADAAAVSAYGYGYGYGTATDADYWSKRSNYGSTDPYAAYAAAYGGYTGFGTQPSAGYAYQMPQPTYEQHKATAAAYAAQQQQAFAAYQTVTTDIKSASTPVLAVNQTSASAAPVPAAGGGGNKLQPTGQSAKIQDAVKNSQQPVIGLSYMVEIVKAGAPAAQPVYLCNLCRHKCTPKGGTEADAKEAFFQHAASIEHSAKYLEKHHFEESQHLLAVDQSSADYGHAVSMAARRVIMTEGTGLVVQKKLDGSSSAYTDPAAGFGNPDFLRDA